MEHLATRWSTKSSEGSPILARNNFHLNPPVSKTNYFGVLWRCFEKWCSQCTEGVRKFQRCQLRTEISVLRHKAFKNELKHFRNKISTCRALISESGRKFQTRFWRWWKGHRVSICILEIDMPLLPQFFIGVKSPKNHLKPAIPLFDGPNTEKQ